MNNSLERLIDGMVATLREEVIPQVGTEFARGQAFGVIYMLNSLRLRAAWSSDFLGEQLAAQATLASTLSPLAAPGTETPALPKAAAASADNGALEALRDQNEALICDWITWLDEHSEALEDTRREAITAALRTYMDRQLKHELKTSAKPMFAEISAGEE
ncbi:hypothetical protein [Polycyclovorans algicola]|uniref:hypothetical protein n=1 Tax=Polycyclovorans algicola TaxID=616992 RepID=UPI001267A4A0|nr:hypothetical protein [Polycyclovorans algicola]